MEKEDLKKKRENINNQPKEKNTETVEDESTNNGKNLDDKDQKKEISAEEELENLKDKLARTFAEMENQRRRFEKKEKTLLNMVDLLLQKNP